MALVRVYCGLASTGSAEAQPGQEVWLTVAVVDDAGRLLDVCEVTDDAGGYAELSALLAHRAGGSSGAGVATDSDDHVVIQLLTAAGRYLAYTDEDSADDYAERFADEASADEAQATAPQRQAIGLARALQAGVLSAVPQSPPRDMIALKPLLSAHAAVVSGRQGSAATLREVLRELYPAALRAYPDPAEPIPLAILDALPEPGLLGSGQATRSKDAQVVADLTASGVSDSATLTDAISALRLAIVETPRRTGVTRALTAAVSETIRQSVASVQACDKAAGALVDVLGNKMASKSHPGGRLSGLAPAAQKRPAVDNRQARNRTQAAQPTPSAVQATPQTAMPDQSHGRRGRVLSAPPIPHVVSAPPSHVVSAPPAQSVSAPPSYVVSAPPSYVVSAPPSYVVSAPPAQSVSAPAARAMSPLPTRVVSAPPAQAVSAPPAPVISAPPSQAVSAPPSGPERGYRQSLTDQFRRRSIPTPPQEAQAGSQAHPAAQQERQHAHGMGGPAQQSQPAQPQPPRYDQHVQYDASYLAQQAGQAEYNPFAATPSQPVPSPTSGSPTASFPDSPHFGVESVDYETGFRPYDSPAPRLDQTIPAPGARSVWPTNGDLGSDLAMPSLGSPYGQDPLSAPSDAQPVVDVPKPREGRVVPPWQSDDLPAEPPSLRLVDPATLPVADTSGSSYTGANPLGDPHRADPPSLRLVDSDRAARSGQRRARIDHQEPPTAMDDKDGDGDLLIFAATRSAWFVEPNDEVAWSTTAADAGWQAAQHAAQPAVGEDTRSGLPRRVPQQNLVPGSALSTQERPLRIVRDAAAIAANTTGYFQGWRRGQEVGGYSVGGRPGRESARGWNFTRDTGREDNDREYEYRSAHS